MKEPRLRFYSTCSKWLICQISSFSSLVAGATPSTKVKEYWENGTIPWMSSGEIHNKYIYSVDNKITELGYTKTSTKMLPINTVLIALAGQGKTRGTVAISKIPLCTNQSIAGIICNGSVNPLYLFHCLESKYEDLRAASSGEGGRGGLNLKIIGEFFVPVPCIEEQQKIADFLSTVDEKIALKQKKYDSLVEVKKGLLQKIFSQAIRFKRDDGGEYPEWEELQLAVILDVITDYVAAGSFADIAAHVEYKSEKDYAQLVRTTDLKNNFSNSDFVYVGKEAFEYLWRVNLDTECVILPNVGNCGEVYFISPNKLPYSNNVLGPNAILVKSHKNSNRFLSYLFLSRDFQDKLKLIISPTGQRKFNKTELKEIEISLPCIKEQQKIADFLSTVDEKIEAVHKELEGWKTIKKGLLQQMFC